MDAKWLVGLEHVDLWTILSVVPFFQVSFNKTAGFYLRNGYGCSNHVGHHKITSDKNNFTVPLLTDQKKSIANAWKGVVRDIIRN